VDNFGILNGHLVYLINIWYIWNIFGLLVYFSSFGTLCQEKKSGNPALYLGIDSRLKYFQYIYLVLHDITFIYLGTSTMYMVFVSYDN
jgi:hypothetical protein